MWDSRKDWISREDNNESNRINIVFMSFKRSQKTLLFIHLFLKDRMFEFTGFFMITRDKLRQIVFMKLKWDTRRRMGTLEGEGEKHRGEQRKM